jgi:hypothetical protein
MNDVDMFLARWLPEEELKWIMREFWEVSFDEINQAIRQIRANRKVQQDNQRARSGAEMEHSLPIREQIAAAKKREAEAKEQWEKDRESRSAEMREESAVRVAEYRREREEKEKRDEQEKKRVKEAKKEHKAAKAEHDASLEGQQEAKTKAEKIKQKYQNECFKTLISAIDRIASNADSTTNMLRRTAHSNNYFVWDDARKRALNLALRNLYLRCYVLSQQVNKPAQKGKSK